MNPRERGRQVSPRRRASLLARAALALYPPSWRARYRDEVLMLLEDSGGRLREVASVAWRALPAWFCPPPHLHDRSARMRASQGWFWIITLAGFAAAAVAAAGPGLALRRLRPRGPALRLAATAAGVSAAATAVAALAIVAAITGLCLYSRHVTSHISPVLVLYLVPVVIAAAVTTVSAARGARAARAAA